MLMIATGIEKLTDCFFAWYWLKPGRLESCGSLETAPLSLWYSRWAVFITCKSLVFHTAASEVPEARGPGQLK